MFSFMELEPKTKNFAAALKTFHRSIYSQENFFQKQTYRTSIINKYLQQIAQVKHNVFNFEARAGITFAQLKVSTVAS